MSVKRYVVMWVPSMEHSSMCDFCCAEYFTLKS